MTCSGARASRLLVCLLFLTAVAPVSAKTALAFRGSADRCKSYMIFEAGWLTRIAQSGPSAESRFLIPMDLGFMTNLSSRKAIGVSMHIAPDERFTRIGFRPRLKLWTGKRSGFDFSLGATFSDRIKKPGLASEISYSMAELLSIDLYYESYRLTAGTHHTALYMGATGRSYLAFVAPVVIVIGLAIFDPIDMGTGMDF
jgi:hypothetical protein